MYSTAAPKIFSLILLASTAVATSAASKPTTAYEALEAFNFPSGMLPKGATGFELDEDTGKFKVHYDGSCSYSLEGSYQLSYNREISGRISQNKLTDLKGVSVKVFFLWLNIVEVRRSGDRLQFSVGIASADFPIDNFEDSPQCGCGFDCDDFRIRAPQVSSV